MRSATAPPGSRPPWRPDAEGLRGAAVLAVLIFHAVPAWLPGGFVGVDVFFVLSGFLVGRLVMADFHAGRFSFYDFLARRSRRLLPALLVVLWSTLVAGPWFLFGDDLWALAQQAAAAAVYGANVLAWTQSGYFDQAAAFKPLIHLWSLGIEEQFYLVFPPAFLYFLARSARAGRTFLLLTTLGSFAACVLLTPSHPEAAFYLPFTRFWELFLGAGLALRERHGTLTLSAGAREALAWAGAGMLGGALLFLGEDAGFPGVLAALPAVGTLLLLAAGPDTTLARTVLSRGVLPALGGVSYAAYLWHWPVLVFVRYQHGAELPPGLALASSAASLLLAWLSTRLLEPPFRTGAWSRTPRAATTLWALAALTAAVAVPFVRAFAPPTPLALAGLQAHGEPPGDPWRAGEGCYGTEDVPFGDACLGGPEDGRPLAVLWGDSHAAALWPGLSEQAARRDVRLAQLSRARCLPVPGLTGRREVRCEAVHARAVATIAALRPAIVVLAAKWSKGYDQIEAFGAGFEAVARELEAAGVRRVVVVGPVPAWEPTLVSALTAETHHRGHGLGLPPSTTIGLSPLPFRLEAPLRAAAAGAGMAYVSPLAALCRGDTCRAWADPERQSALMMFDDAHLTPEGSRVLAGLLADDLFPPPAR